MTDYTQGNVNFLIFVPPFFFAAADLRVCDLLGCGCAQRSWMNCGRSWRKCQTKSHAGWFYLLSSTGDIQYSVFFVPSSANAHSLSFLWFVTHSIDEDDDDESDSGSDVMVR